MAGLQTDPVHTEQRQPHAGLSRICSGWLALAALIAFLVDLWMMVYWIYTVNS